MFDDTFIVNDLSGYELLRISKCQFVLKWMKYSVILFLIKTISWRFYKVWFKNFFCFGTMCDKIIVLLERRRSGHLPLFPSPSWWPWHCFLQSSGGSFLPCLVRIWSKSGPPWTEKAKANSLDSCSFSL